MLFRSWPFRIIREIIVRKNEEKYGLFMHGTGVILNNKGNLILGNSGSGKTTLAIKLLNNKDNIQFLSNDRVFMYYNDNPTIEYFPIPIVFAMGTVKNNIELDRYFKTTRILENRAGKNYERSNVNDKVDVPLTDIEKIFKSISMKPTNILNNIIFSKLNKKDKKCLNIRELSKKEKIIKLNQTCFTMYDWESLRLEWIYNRKINQNDLIENKINTIEKIVDDVPIIELEYGFETEEKKLIKRIKEI